MQIKKTKFKGLKIVTNKIYKDSRGYFKEDFKQALFKGFKFIFNYYTTINCINNFYLIIYFIL